MRKLIGALWLLVAMMLASSAWAAESGYIHALTGDVTMTRPGKPAAKAKVGDLFEEGTSFVTGADGTATLKFADGQVLALSQGTQFTVTNYVYSTAEPAKNNIVFNLVRGGARFVTGLIGQTNPSKFALRTPTLTAGVRGTDGVVAVAENGSTVVWVLDGTVIVTTATGQILVVNKDGSVYLAVVGTNPPSFQVTGPIPTASLPAGALALLQSTGDLASKNLPTPTPVDVIQAAKEVADAAQSAPGVGVPSPTPGPAGGGGGGLGVSPS